jgi:putative ABC transport system substrate-binding protein
MRRRSIVRLAFLLAGVLAMPLAAGGQARPRLPRVGFICAWLCPSPAGDKRPLPLHEKSPENLMADEAFVLGLRALGYVDGQNLAIEWRAAQGQYDRFPGLAAELARLKVDVIVTTGGPWVRAFAQANPALPIVLAQVADPVMSGLVASLARPGGSITGLSLPSHEMEGKQIELLKTVIPELSRVALVYNPENPASAPHLKRLEAAGQALGVRLQFVRFRDTGDFDGVVTAIREGRPGALLLDPDPVLLIHQVRFVEIATQHRIPAVSQFRDVAELGALMSYGPNANDMFRRAAAYVDKILRGGKPGELPMEQPMRFELVLNLRAARALGLTVPSAVLMRADLVIQ